MQIKLVTCSWSLKWEGCILQAAVMFAFSGNCHPYYAPIIMLPGTYYAHLPIRIAGILGSILGRVMTGHDFSRFLYSLNTTSAR